MVINCNDDHHGERFYATGNLTVCVQVLCDSTYDPKNDTVFYVLKYHVYSCCIISNTWNERGTFHLIKRTI